MRKPGVRTQMNTKTMQHMKKENRRKHWVFAGFVAGAEGLGLGCRLGRFAAERHWRSLTPRHALRRGAAVPRCRVLMRANEKKRGKQMLVANACLSFLAGAEGLEPSARGFGVDVGGRTRKRGMDGTARLFRTSPKRVVLVWCCEKYLG